MNGKDVLLVAHSNTIRAIIKHLDGIPDHLVPEVSVPSAIPCVYSFYHISPPAPASSPTPTPASAPTVSPVSASVLEAGSNNKNKRIILGIASTTASGIRPGGSFLMTKGLIAVSQKKALLYVQKMSNTNAGADTGADADADADAGAGAGAGADDGSNYAHGDNGAVRAEGENKWLIIE